MQHFINATLFFITTFVKCYSAKANMQHFKNATFFYCSVLQTFPIMVYIYIYSPVSPFPLACVLFPFF